MEDFVEWGREFGIDFSKFSIQKIENQGFGVVAKKSISYGEPLIEIPEEIIITLDKVLKDRRLQEVLRHGKQFEKVDSMDLFLIFLTIYRFEEDSFFWAKYFRILPEEYGLPIFWKDKYKSCLPRSFQKMLAKELAMYEKRLNFAKEMCPEIEDDDFKWAWSAFLTRNVKVSHAEYLKRADYSAWKRPSWLQDGEYDDSALVPFFDLINHTESASVQYIYQRRDEKFKLTVKQEICEGDQIFINYGTYGSFDKLMDYGYVEGGMPNFNESFFVEKEEILEVSKKLKISLPSASEIEDIEENSFEIFRASVSPQMEEFLEVLTKEDEKIAAQIKIELFSNIIQNIRKNLLNLGADFGDEIVFCRRLYKKVYTMISDILYD